MNKKINEILTTIRKEHKLTRPDIERIAGFKVSTIESYERGSRKPSIEYIEFISLYFGYKKEYIEGKSEDKFLDYGIKTLLMYQSIYNYDYKKMAELLAISLKDYLELLKKNDLKSNIDFLVKISTILEINLSSLLEADFRETTFDSDTGIVENIYFDKLDNKIIITIQKEVYYKIINGKDITHDYYASIIKQRNQPEIITPDTQKESIPDKYKEILELLPYASDSFTQNLKNKLLELKKAQQIEDL